MAGFPITRDQMENHLRGHGFITNAMMEPHLEQMSNITSAAMRQFVTGALREEHAALE